MMYKKRDDNFSLEEVLAKLRGTEPKPPTPVTYASSDISAAKTILDRLLDVPARDNVISVKLIPKVLYE